MATEFDVIIYGATGFTGRQTAAWFARHAPPGLRWAIAGRNRDRLVALADALKPAAWVVADGTDDLALDALCKRTRIVATTAGPFARYGDRLIDACVRRRVDYLDITGETPFIKRVIARHHARAAADGTRIIPFCGFDSVPSDLGTLRLVEHLRQGGHAPVRRVTAAFSGRGGLNGGTFATVMTMAEMGWLDEVNDPLLLNPPDQQGDALRSGNLDPRAPKYDPARRGWLAPFFMGPINSRVVRRSAALFSAEGRGHGPNFRYAEYLDAGRGVRGAVVATAVAVGQMAFEPLVRFAPTRRLLERLAPAPGSGPSEATMDGGFVRVRLVGEGEDGHRARLLLHAEGDPGNRVTVQILGEAALMLAGDRSALPKRAGVLTPATALGSGLLNRLAEGGWQVTLSDD